MMNLTGDMLIRIKNAYFARHPKLEVPYSSLSERLAKILEKEGYLKGVKIVDQDKKLKSLELELKYEGKKAVLNGLRQISKPGLRRYISLKDLNTHRRGVNLVILSTPKGLLSGKEAKKEKVGGELLVEVW